MNKKEALIIARRSLKRILINFPERLISLVFYGSLARGESKESSDIDLFVVLKEPFEFIPTRREIYKLLNKGQKEVEISSLIMSKKEVTRIQPIHFELYADGIVLYDTEDFMKKILKRVSEIIAKLGSVRYRTQDRCYGWILKKDIKVGEIIEIEL
ncbi:MAG: nucleotidyltransferase domain-containing protein [Candidatus Edwardsbacteria bacterium]